MSEIDRVNLSLANKLREQLTIFFVNDLGPVFWNKTIIPIIKEMCETGLATGSKSAVALTGEFILANGELIWTTQMTTNALARTGVSTANSLITGALRAANIIGFMLMMSQSASAESSELQWEYKNYVKKYLTYLLKAAERNGNHLANMLPPMNYSQWLNRSGKGEWWQN